MVEETIQEEELLFLALARAGERANPGFTGHLINSLRELSLPGRKLSPHEKQLLEELRHARS